MKPVVFALLLLLAGLGPVHGDPLDGASMLVFSDGQASSVTLPPLLATMTVFGADAVTRQVPVQMNTAPGTGNWTLSAGYRRDTLDWNIASSQAGGSPDVLSELEWKMHMVELRLRGEWPGPAGITLLTELAYAHALPGSEARDSDYARDNRQGEFSRSYAEARGSSVAQLSLGAGKDFFPHPRLQLSPSFGYAYERRHLRMRHGRQALWNTELAETIVDWGDTQTGPFAGLSSSYSPRLHGPWLGLRLLGQASDRLSLRGEIRRQWFDYNAKANWNLRGDLAHPVSFRHTGTGDGWLLELGADWRLSPQSSLSLGLRRQRQELRDGSDQLFTADGKSSNTRLNQVNQDSWSASLGYRMDFQ